MQTKPKTPREYLSWSQIDLWQKNKAKYIQTYVYGETKDYSGYELGKLVSTALEEGKSDIEGIDLLITALPAYPKREFELRAELKDGREVIQLLAKLDGYNPFTAIIGEYKTGAKWTQKIANASGQLRFYNMLHQLKTGKPARRLFLHWVETVSKDGQIEITGRIETFEVTHSYAELVREMIKVKKIYKEISEAYAQELDKIK